MYSEETERLLSEQTSTSIDVLIMGRSGTSKSILINGIFGREVIQERHGVVSTARSSSLEFYNSTIDGIQVNVWVSSQLQDSSATDEQQYLEDLKAQCSNVDLVLYCIKMTETRFTPGNPDDVAITKISQALGNRVWEKTIFVLTYANLATEVSYSGMAQSTGKSLDIVFQEAIENWTDVLKTTLVRATGKSASQFSSIKVVPSGHYKQPHLPGYHNWLSILWSTCQSLITDEPTKMAFSQISPKQFKADQEERIQLSHGDFSIPQMLANKNLWSTRRKVACGGGAVLCVGVVAGVLTGDVALAIILPLVGFALGCILTYALHHFKYI